MKEMMIREGVEWIKAFALGMIIFVFIRIFFFSNYIVEGESMLPTLEDGNKVVVNKLGYETDELERFDVIVFHANEEEDFVKRVIGLPGDKVEYREDMLFINDKQVKESFLKHYREQSAGGYLTGDFSLEDLTGVERVPKGKLFVLGDNRLGSWDSRQFGFISEEQVVGKVNLRYWPLEEMDVSF